MGKRKSPYKRFQALSNANELNYYTYLDYLERLSRICLSIFEWVDIPSSMSSRFLEETLFLNGRAALLYSDKFGYINTKASANGYINIYGEPTKLNCFSFEFNEYRDIYQGFENEDKDGNRLAILVRNNHEATPTVSQIELFAYRLADAQRSCDVNIALQKRPYLILTSEQQVLSMKTAIAQVQDNELAVIGDKNSLTPEAIKTLDLNVPFIADKIMLYKQRIWNEFLTFMGINNLEGKKERYLEEEIDSNNEVINMNLQAQLSQRKLACKQFNEYFGKKIEVRVRSDLYNLVKQTESIITSENMSKLKENLITEKGEVNG